MIGMGLLQVELREHVGQYRKYDSAGNFLGTFPQVFDQWQIFVKAPDAESPFRYGYVGKKPGSPLNALVTLPPEIVEEIREKVLHLIVEQGGGGGERRVHNPTGFTPKNMGNDSEYDEDSE